MFFLAGLLGMMVLGSVAFVGAPTEDEDLGDDQLTADTTPQGEGADGDAETDTGILDFALGDADAPAEEPSEQELAATSTEPAAEDVVDDSSAMSSLFGQMGLINMPGLIEEGSDGDDTLNGSGGTDLLAGGEGDDVIDSGASDDELYGNGGADTLLGGGDNDTLHGGAGMDAMAGGDGDDHLFGHDGDDEMLGDAGDDELWGGLGADLMKGGDGADALLGREGADTLDGGLGQDTLFGGWDNDLLNGVERGANGQDEDEGDFLNGGDGDDTLAIGEGDVATGGDGADVFVLGDWIVENGAEITDYDSSEDQIVVVYDDADSDTDPILELRVSEDNAEVTEIVVDGTVLSTIPTSSSPTLDSIILVGESAAGQLEIA